MKSNQNVMDLPVPCSKTALMQHLQTLVLRGNPWWIGGLVPPQKFEAFALKMAARYPLLRDERGRTYDRSKGQAGFHFVAFASEGAIAWWILCSDGKGNLIAPGSLDVGAARHAMKADGHITFEDYVLLYAHKKDARTIRDGKSGKEKKVIKDCSTWTWKIRNPIYSELVSVLEKEIRDLRYGDDGPSVAPYGLRGMLSFQRRRPLFSGVRSQVLELHRIAEDGWARVRQLWLGRHPRYLAQYGDNAGKLRSIREITSRHLPKMVRFKVFDDKTMRSLAIAAQTHLSVAETPAIFKRK